MMKCPLEPPLLLRGEGRLELCGRDGVGLELLEVGLQVHLLEIRQDEVEGASLAEDDRRVAVEASIVLDGLGLDPRESPFRLLEDAVQEDGEGDAREGAALRPARPALAHVFWPCAAVASRM